MATTPINLTAPAPFDFSAVVDPKKLKAAAEAARGANLARKDGKHIPFSMNPDTVIALVSLAECWAAEAAQAVRSRLNAWAVSDMDAKKAETARLRVVAVEAENDGLQRALGDALAHLRLSAQIHLKLYEACQADRELRSSDAGALLGELWPMVCKILGKPEHQTSPGACAIPGCDGFDHTAKAKAHGDQVAKAASEATYLERLGAQQPDPGPIDPMPIPFGKAPHAP